MKHVLLIIDGASDVPLSELNGQTPLQAAFTPHLDWLARHALIGRLVTAHKDFPVESLICIMGMLGYDPVRYYPSGRASFEALARGVPLHKGDMTFRCNIVRVSDDGNILEDFTANMISDTCARKLLARTKLPFDSWELHPGQSYRNLLIVRGAGIPASTISCSPPHMHIGENVHALLPRAASPDAEGLAFCLRSFLLESFSSFIKTPRIPTCSGNMLWLWSPSGVPHLPSFRSLHSMEGTVIAGLDFMHGLAVATDLNFEIIPGATGYIDTDYEAKANAACSALESTDFVVLHVNASDEAAHLRNGRLKTKVIENVDRLVLEPLLRHLRQRFPDAFSLAICADHMTRSTDGKHVGEPTPCLIWPAPADVSPQPDARFTEHCAACGPLLTSRGLIPLMTTEKPSSAQACSIGNCPAPPQA